MEEYKIEVIQVENEERPTAEQAAPIDNGLRARIIRAIPFISKHMEFAAQNACCGACINCIGPAVIGTVLPIMGSKEKANEPPEGL